MFSYKNKNISSGKFNFEAYKLFTKKKLFASFSFKLIICQIAESFAVLAILNLKKVIGNAHNFMKSDSFALYT